MTRGELLEYLTKEATKFRNDTNAICRNEHLTGISEKEMPSRSQIDGVLVAFINHIGVSQCIDYALSHVDLEKNIK